MVSWKLLVKGCQKIGFSKVSRTFFDYYWNNCGVIFCTVFWLSKLVAVSIWKIQDTRKCLNQFGTALSLLANDNINDIIIWKTATLINSMLSGHPTLNKKSSFFYLLLLCSADQYYTSIYIFLETVVSS